MAGHNKWSKIKNKKGKEDAKRAKQFTKLGRAIMVATKEGGDNPEYNPALQAAIDKAKEYNMPNDNIDRAIKRGSSDMSGDEYESITYEGYGPSGIALIVECLTDNRNRTAADVRHLFDKFGGNLGTNGSVSFMFNHMGVIALDKDDYDEDEVMMVALEGGADDVRLEDDLIEVYTSIDDFHPCKTYLEDQGYDLKASDIMYLAKTYQKLDDPKDVNKMEKLIDSLEDNDDVQEVYHNWEENE